MSAADQDESDVAALDLDLEELVDPEILGGVVDDLATLIRRPEFDDNHASRETLAALARGISDSYGNNDFRRLPPIKARQLAMAWQRRAARLGDLDSLVELARREADVFSGRAMEPNQENGISDENWMAKAFDAVLDSFQHLDSYSYPAKKEEKIKKLLGMSRDLLRWKNSQSPKEAWEWLVRLLNTLAQESLFDADPDGVRALREEVTPESQGIRVLDGFMPSNDRSMKATLEQYRGLCDFPTPLAGMPDLKALKETLDGEFPWFGEITAWLLKHLAVRSAGTLGFRIPPLLLLGPPGVGKTAYLQRLAGLSGVPFLSLSLAGKNDNRDLAGTARGWGTGHPSRVIALIKQHQIANPIVLLDEMDKAGGSDHNGRIWDTLLTLLEPESARRVYDDFLWGHADLSRVSWIATANSVRLLPRPLLDRLEVKTVDSPQKKHYPAIIRRTIAKYLEQEGLHVGWVPELTPEDWQWLKKYYKSPRLVRRAAEMLVNHKLTQCRGGLML